MAAEALIFGVMASLAQDVVLKLIKRFKDVKGTNAETRELKDFVDYLTKNEELYTSSSNEVRTMFGESLDKAKMKLKEWSSEKSGFLARSSSERVQEVQALRRSVESAISLVQIKFMDVIHAEQIRARKEHNDARNSLEKRKVDLWQQLWVPIDSKKQANDLKERLRGLEGVKDVQIDQPRHKVSVLSNTRTHALLENARLKDKRKPTAWADRPRIGRSVNRKSRS